MLDPRFLRRQAQRLRAIAGQLVDPDVTAAIIAIAREIEERASDIERGGGDRPAG